MFALLANRSDLAVRVMRSDDISCLYGERRRACYGMTTSTKSEETIPHEVVVFFFKICELFTDDTGLHPDPELWQANCNLNS